MLQYERIDISEGIDVNSILWGISRNEGLTKLSNYVFEDKGVL